MVTTAIRNTISSVAQAKKHLRISEYAKQQPIPIRHLSIGFKGREIDQSFIFGNQFATMFFATLSVFLTYGEDLVIETARHHRELLTDPILKQRVTSLIGQEAIHSRLHNEFNDALVDESVAYPVTLYRFLGSKFFEHIFHRFPQPLKLSMMAGIEHFTAVLAEWMMEHEELFYVSDDAKTRALWMWHMLEESEHKDVAYDVYQTLNGSYPLRVAGFLLAYFTILGLIPLAAVGVPVFSANRRKMLFTKGFWKDAKIGVKALFGAEDGVFGSTQNKIWDYLRTDFHPNDYDNAEHLAYFQKKLLEEGGALHPFFVKQFIPPVRS